jgi:hypothetical protein
MCSNLRNKKYHIKNREYSEKEYLQEIQKYSQISHKNIKIEYVRFLLAQVRKYANIQNSIEVQGDNIQNAKNVKFVFDGDILENVAYSAFVDDVKDSVDLNYGNANTILQYETL